MKVNGVITTSISKINGISLASISKMLGTAFASTGIVTSNLMQYLDAGNVASYPGSGSTWTDLSTNAKNSTLANGPTYSSDGSGSIVFDGTNDYAVNSTSLYNPTTTPNESVFIWWYPQAKGNIVSELGQGTPNSGWHDSNIEIATTGVISLSTWHGSLTNKVTSAAQAFNTWYNIGFTYSGTTLTAYINGVSIGTTTFTRSTNTALHYAIAAADSTNMGTNAYATGKCASFLAYNKALTAAEVLQNYNAINDRFPMAATGGTITQVGNYKVHTFATEGSSNFVVTRASNRKVKILVVAGGGGGGGGYVGAGGGGGGVIENTNYTLSGGSGSYSVVVGSGGAGSGTYTVAGGNGTNSTFDSNTAVGGGGGASHGANAGIGGSGGGGAGIQFSNPSQELGAAGTAGQGNAGGNGSGSPPYYGAGGGGGASTAGGAGTGTQGGDGGAGIQSTIDSNYYGGGGGGSVYLTSGIAGAGGVGGGGAGGLGGAGTNGTANTGGGGGGAERDYPSTGGNGGSGIVIISYYSP